MFSPSVCLIDGGFTQLGTFSIGDILGAAQLERRTAAVWARLGFLRSALFLHAVALSDFGIFVR